MEQLVTTSGEQIEAARPYVVSGYRVDCWLDKERCEPVFGVGIRIASVGWCRLAYDSKPYLVKTEQEAKARIAALRAAEQVKS